jgi:hypothetical protein
MSILHLSARTLCDSGDTDHELMIVRSETCWHPTEVVDPDRQWREVCKMKLKKTQPQQSYHPQRNYSISTVKQWNNVGNILPASPSRN